MTERIKAVICDIDNTLIDITHRYHLLKGKETDWDAFLNEDLIRKDTPIQDMVDIVNCLNLRYPIIFVTGRNSGIEEITRWQIENYCSLGTHGYKLIMRDDADRESPDALVKETLYREQVEPYYDIVAAFDDRECIVDLWRKLGITTYHIGERALGGGF